MRSLVRPQWGQGLRSIDNHIADNEADQHGPAPVEMRDSQSAAFAVWEPPPGLRIDNLVILKLRRRIVPVAIFAALRKGAEFGRAVPVEKWCRRAKLAETSAQVLAHRRRRCLAGDGTHADAVEIGAKLDGAQQAAAHEARYAP